MRLCIKHGIIDVREVAVVKRVVFDGGENGDDCGLWCRSMSVQFLSKGVAQIVVCVVGKM